LKEEAAFSVLLPWIMVSSEVVNRKGEMSFSNVGFIGLGKLGLPCAAALSVRGKKKVFGYDINPDVRKYVETHKVPYEEAEIENYLSLADISIENSIAAVVQKSEILFLAVQTPHEATFEGVTPVPTETKDFDYSFLVKAVKEISNSLKALPQKELMIVVISTVLPGTMRKHILPELEQFGSRVNFCYNPFFIAMGNTIPDYLNPEFILIGSDDVSSASTLGTFYQEFLSSVIKPMQIESAELAKVAYNTFIGFKIVFANTLSEITNVRGGDVDEITNALADANMRLMSKKYLSAGMADGGGCHPRDQIAMSWLAADAKVSVDIFGWLARARDNQTRRQAELIAKISRDSNLPVVLLGASYKANINLTVGSPALLLGNFLTEMGQSYTFYDPFVFPDIDLPIKPSVFFISTNHNQFKDIIYPQGSICIDPWGNMIKKQDGIRIIRPGRSRWI
jgi:UDPglucose 6-dehydrogenase